ncbi:MAG: ABC transporter ATP-binding protein [Sediminibacterium sp.]|nr:ABC transporter ATP-binding protein [Sediminibacterium sp.]
MKILYLYIKPFKKLVFIALLLAGINQTFSLFDPMLFGNLIDHFARNPFTDKSGLARTEHSYIIGVLKILGLMVCTAMVSRIAKAFQDYIVNLITQKFGAKIFTTGLQHAMNLPFQNFENSSSGETLSILTKVRIDTEKFITYLINVLFSILISIIFVTIYAISLHWAIIPIFLFGSITISYVTNFLSKRIKSIQKNIVRETTSLAGSTTESIRNIELVKSLGLVKQEVNRLNVNTYKILSLELFKVKKIRSLSFVQGTMVNTLRQIILFTMMMLIFRNFLTVGQLISLQFYSFFIFGPLQEIGAIIISYREAEASLENFHKLMQQPKEEIPENAIEINHVENLKFNNIFFKHQTANFNALENISFEVNKGETIAFVGPSGAGKSTLVKLLVGLYKPQQGEIYFNNIEINTINFEYLRNFIGFVTQDTQLFAGTIQENLQFVAPKASEAAMLQALTKANCTNILEKGEKGLQNLIGEGGIKLSGGEKQRLSIARALLRKPQLLIFDEATSALDSLTEEILSKTIQQISAEKNQITIMIAHRLSTIMHADKIFVIEKGKIIETGNHNELLNSKGLYYAMWRQQIGERKTN